MIKKHFPNFNALLLGLALFLPSAGPSNSAELTVKVADQEPPKEIDPSIRATLQTKAVQILDGEKPVFGFWFRTEIPLKSKAEPGEKALQSIGETTLLGVVSFQSSQRDYKDNEISPGLYTARFALQPQDGDHLGTAEYSYFIVLIPVKGDTQLDGITTYKAMVKASGKATASGHPLVMSLRPGSSAEGGPPKLQEPAPDHKSVRVNVPAKATGSADKASLVFEVVFKGKGKI